MHVVNLSMGYGLGVKENKKTVKVTDEQGDVKKVQSIVTPGGAFPEGARLVKISRTCVNYFAKSPRRKDKLENQRIAMDLPKIALQNFPETRVAYVVPTYQSLLVNRYLLTLSVSDATDDFHQFWSKLSTQDFSAIQEMEAVTQILFAYAVNDSQQSNSFNTSLLSYYCKTMKAALYREAYDIMKLGRQPATTMQHNWPMISRQV